MNSKQETLTNFSNRILQSQSLLTAKLKQSNESVEVKRALCSVFQKISLDTYVRNIPFNLQQMVRTKEIGNLEDAVTFVSKKEQFQKYMKSIEIPTIGPTKFNNPQNQQRSQPRRNNSHPQF